eukprot:5647586-Amphidinium_carterae.1
MTSTSGQVSAVDPQVADEVCHKLFLLRQGSSVDLTMANTRAILQPECLELPLTQAPAGAGRHRIGTVLGDRLYCKKLLASPFHPTRAPFKICRLQLIVGFFLVVSSRVLRGQLSHRSPFLLIPDIL